MKTIKVLGTGCKKCQKTAEIIAETAKQQSIEIDIDKVTDPAEIMQFQVMSTPAVVVDGKLVHSGSVPTSEQVKDWL